MQTHLKFNKIVICGAARTGTTLLHAMMRTFEEALVIPGEVPGAYMPHLLPFSNVIVVTKAPNDILSIDPIMLLYPFTLCLMMYRDPRDTLCSKVGPDYGHRIYKPYYSHRIADSVRMRTIALANYPDNTMAIQYEKLILDPDEVQEGLELVTGMTKHCLFSEYYKIPDIPRLNEDFTPHPVSDINIGAWRRDENIEWLREVMEAEKGVYNPNILARLVAMDGYEETEDWLEVLNGR